MSNQMTTRLAATILGLILAFLILFVSIMRTAAVKYTFVGPQNKASNVFQNVEIDYYLAYHGAVTPDHPLWSIKVVRDKLWLLVTTDQEKKVLLNLLLADKRMSASKDLFERGKYELGFSTLIKAERYLLTAYQLEEKLRLQNKDTSVLLQVLAKASLKHCQTILYISSLAPQDAVAQINESAQMSRNVYNEISIILLGKGIQPHPDPLGDE